MNLTEAEMNENSVGEGPVERGVGAQEATVRKLELDGYRRVSWHSETPRHVCVDWEGRVFSHLPLERSRFAVMLAR